MSEGEATSDLFAIARHAGPRAVAAALAAEALASSDRVALSLPLPLLIDATLAALSIGAIAVPLELRLAPIPLAYHLRDSGAACLVTDPAREETARAALRDAPGCALVLLDSSRRDDSASEGGATRTAGPSPITAEAGREVALLSYAPEVPGRPRGLVHDVGGLAAIVRATRQALDLDARDVVSITVPLPEGALVLGLSAASAGASVEEAPSSKTTVLVARARDAVQRASAALTSGAPLRLVVSVGGPVGAGTADALAARASGLEIASARIVRELPLWLSLELHGRSLARPRTRGGVLAGLETTRLEGGHLAVRGPAIPRAYHEAPEETRLRIRDGWLVSIDRELDERPDRAGAAGDDRSALDVLDADLEPRRASPSALARVRERAIEYPIGRGRGASLAVEAGLKPMVRELLASPDLDAARARFERAGFAVEVSPLRFGPTHDGWLGRQESRDDTARPPHLDRQPLYAGPDRARLRLAIDAERSRTLEGARELGALLGYPSCCVEAFVSAGPDRRAVRLWAQAAARTRSFAARLNALDPDVFTYVSWFPCRFDCEPSRALADELGAHLARAHPRFVEAIDRALAAPRLVLAPEIQLRLEGDLDGPRLLVRAISATSVDRDPRAALPPREAAVLARALDALTGASEIAVLDGALVVDGARRPIAFEPPLPLLLPFGRDAR